MRGLNFVYIVISILLSIRHSRRAARIFACERHGNEVIIKKKRTYYSVYIFCFVLFYIVLLKIGSEVGMDHKFTSFLHFCDLYSEKYDYVLCGEIPSLEKDYRKGAMLDSVKDYRVKRFEDVGSVVKKIVLEDNSFAHDDYQVSDVQVEYKSPNYYLIYIKEEVHATVKTENRGPVKRILIRWDEEKLKKRIGR